MLIIRFRKRVRIDAANRLRVVDTRGNRVSTRRGRITSVIRRQNCAQTFKKSTREMKITCDQRESVLFGFGFESQCLIKQTDTKLGAICR